MFGLFKKRSSDLEEKSIPNYFLGGDGSGTMREIPPHDMYCKASIAFLCVEKIATQAESYSYKVVSGDKEIKKHPAHDLLFKRSLKCGGQSLFSQLIRNLLIHGEAYALKKPYGGEKIKPAYCDSIFPYDVNKNQINSNVIDSYNVTYGGQSIRLPIDMITGYSDLLRVSLFSSRFYHEGTSPMEAVGIEGRLIERVLKWNLSTLNKGVKPSVVFERDSAVGLQANQVAQLKNEIQNLYAGADNASNFVVLPNGLKMKPMQMTQSDMDFNTTFDKALKSVAMAFKVPLPLIFDDASTLDNYKMAIEEFTLQTVVPLAENIIEAFNIWCAFFFKDDFKIVIDRDSIEALEFKRERKGKRMAEFVKGGILTPNEAREKLGYDPYTDPTADCLYMPSSSSAIELLDNEPATDV